MQVASVSPFVHAEGRVHTLSLRERGGEGALEMRRGTEGPARISPSPLRGRGLGRGGSKEIKRPVSSLVAKRFPNRRSVGKGRMGAVRITRPDPDTYTLQSVARAVGF